MCAGCGHKYRRPVRRYTVGGTKSTIVRDRKYLPKARKPLNRSATQTPQGAVTKPDSSDTAVPSASESQEQTE